MERLAHAAAAACISLLFANNALAAKTAGIAVLTEHADEHLEREVVELARETAASQGEMPKKLRTMSTSIVAYKLQVRAIL
jgi:hypothetical protein